MGILSLVRDDRALIVGLSVATVGVFVGMRAILLRFRDASEIKPVPPKLRYITQETEDSLPMTTLDGLLDHYNYSIRETAAKIVCDRAVNDPLTLQLLLWGITRANYDDRMKNLRALAMLTDLDSLHLLDTPTAYSAFVRSLQLCVGETPYDMIEDTFFDEYYLRDIAEKMCLMFVAQLVHKGKNGVEKLVQAGFVERWLAKQRWGTTEDQRMDNFTYYLRCRNNRIADICKYLVDSRAGSAALERAHLLRPLRAPATTSHLSRFVHQLPGPRHGDQTAGQTDGQTEGPTEGQTEDRSDGTEAAEHQGSFDWVLHPGARVQAEEESAEAGTQTPAHGNAPVTTRQGQNTPEEQRIRRQHREAMVINDGTRPFRRDDIIQRESD